MAVCHWLHIRHTVRARAGVPFGPWAAIFASGALSGNPLRLQALSISLEAAETLRVNVGPAPKPV